MLAYGWGFFMRNDELICPAISTGELCALMAEAVATVTAELAHAQPTGDRILPGEAEVPEKTIHYQEDQR